MRTSRRPALLLPLLSLLVVSAAASLMPATVSGQSNGCPRACATACPTPPYSLCLTGGGTCGIGHTCQTPEMFGTCGMWSVLVVCLGGAEE